MSVTITEFVPTLEQLRQFAAEQAKRRPASRPIRFRKPSPYDHLGICDCIREEVEEALTEWTTGSNACMDGIFKYVLQNAHPDDYDDTCKRVVAELLTAIKIKEDFGLEIYMPTLVQRRYDLNWEQAMVFLHVIEKWGMTEHGSGQRCPWTNDKGEAWREAYEHSKEVYDCMDAYILENLDYLPVIDP